MPMTRSRPGEGHDHQDHADDKPVRPGPPAGEALDSASMSRLHVLFWLLAGLGILLDGFDFFIIGVANPLILSARPERSQTGAIPDRSDPGPLAEGVAPVRAGRPFCWTAARTHDLALLSRSGIFVDDSLMM
ncbi:hypothetical protein [Streptomyces sp. PSAA01]|uniref:hypothetical protein n=1 Tax=Streptomyces sp. PSAA01 TaxID=2912762 RepID=UPI001F43A8D8|nr:hypothetical protein [Streptomyces sp. PSAA01]MCG0286867.1 hypothetical protein [Streptomyces sp. PSAA01]